MFFVVCCLLKEEKKKRKCLLESCVWIGFSLQNDIHSKWIEGDMRCCEKCHVAPVNA